MHARPDPHTAPRPPPGFTARPAAAPWRTALTEAASGAAPGLLFYAPLTGRLDAALILSPDCSIQDRPIDNDTVSRMATLAIRDTLAALVPPETAVTFPAPGVVAINQGEVARVKLARDPTGADWLVLGFCVRLNLRLEAPGLTPWLTDLAEEGVDISGATLLDSLCRHLLSKIDVWRTEGAAGISRAWGRAARQPA